MAPQPLSVNFFLVFISFRFVYKSKVSFALLLTLRLFTLLSRGEGDGRQILLKLLTLPPFHFQLIFTVLRQFEGTVFESSVLGQPHLTMLPSPLGGKCGENRLKSCENHGSPEQDSN